MVHYLDDFLCVGPRGSRTCVVLLRSLEQVAQSFGVPLAADKTEGPTTCLSFLGLEIDSVAGVCRLPKDKLVVLRAAVQMVRGAKKVTLRQLQSLIGRLNFACRIIPVGRVFIRSLSRATAGIAAGHHFIRVTRKIRADLAVWLVFLERFNGKVVFQRAVVQADELELYTDASGSVGFGAYFAGKWCAKLWPDAWAGSRLLKNLAFLELFPLLVALTLWGGCMRDRRVVFFSDNLAVVHSVNNLSAASAPVVRLLRRFVLLCMELNISFRAKHVPGHLNVIADALSRFQWERFRAEAPGADKTGQECPSVLWKIGMECLRDG
ncbi:uncharacterized protein RCH25_053265 [Pelodytes ibericus]